MRFIAGTPCRYCVLERGRARLSSFLLVFLLFGASASSAIGLGETVVIHGFGGWAYGSTDGNAFAVGTDDGNYDNADLTLNVAATPYDKLTIVGQIQFLKQGDEEKAELEYAFAEWAFSDTLKLRIGRVPHPFGIYAEIVNVGTLRPFFLLPQSIYGPQAVVAEFYNGVGLTGLYEGSSGWGLEYDIYVGQLSGDFRLGSIFSTNPDDFFLGFVDSQFDTQDMIGVKMDFVTPVDGFRFGFSGYTGDQVLGRVIGGETPANIPTWALHLEYLTHPLEVRGEYVVQERDGLFETDGGYFEVAYKLTDHWQLAARVEQWDFALTIPRPPGLPRWADQISTHEVTAFGLNYWFNPNFAIKLSTHDVTGNRFAFPNNPTAIMDALLNDRLDDRTRLFTFGTHFAF